MVSSHYITDSTLHNFQTKDIKTQNGQVYKSQLYSNLRSLADLYNENINVEGESEPQINSIVESQVTWSKYLREIKIQTLKKTNSARCIYLMSE